MEKVSNDQLDALIDFAELDFKAHPSGEKHLRLEVLRELKQLRESNTNPREALKKYVDHFGGAHDQDCPEDDTCNCSGKELNDSINEILS